MVYKKERAIFVARTAPQVSIPTFLENGLQVFKIYLSTCPRVSFNPNFLREWFTRPATRMPTPRLRGVSIPTFLENGLQAGA